MMADDTDDNEMMTRAEAWPEGLQLAHEKETLGFYITGHPLRRYLEDVRSISNVGTADLPEKDSGSEVVIGGIVANIRTMRTKKGDAMGVILLEDLEGLVEVLVFPDTYSKTRNVLVADAPVIVKGKLDSDESSTKILASDILTLDHAQAQLITTVTVVIDAENAPPDLAERLKPMIEGKTGSAELIFELRYPDRYTAFVRPNPYLKVLPDKEFVHFVEEICGPNTVKFKT
jgi:DNA polymerase-3 subunit alpha